MVEFTIEPKNRYRKAIRELWQFRELLFYFTWRDIKVKYKETTLGIAWVVLQPLVMTALFVLIFSKGLKLYDKDLPYPVFVLSGLVLWNFVSSSLSHAAHSMELNARIIKKTYFPRLIVPLSALLVATFDLVFGLVLLAFACICYGVPIHFSNVVIAFPLCLLVLGFSATGLACLFSILNAIFKDFRYVIPFVVQVLFFTTPVFYDLSIMDQGWWSAMYVWHPFAAGIELFRTIFENDSPQWVLLWKPTLTSIALFWAGLFVFNKMESNLADLI